METFEIAGNENYELMTEVLDGNIFLHCNVYKYSPSVYKSILASLINLKEECLSTGVTHLFTLTSNPKFVTSVIKTAKKIAEVDGPSGIKEVYVWELVQR
jgi:hypothetical protein